MYASKLHHATLITEERRSTHNNARIILHGIYNNGTIISSVYDDITNQPSIVAHVYTIKLRGLIFIIYIFTNNMDCSSLIFQGWKGQNYWHQTKRTSRYISSIGGMRNVVLIHRLLRDAYWRPT